MRFISEFSEAVVKLLDIEIFLNECLVCVRRAVAIGLLMTLSASCVTRIERTLERPLLLHLLPCLR